MTYIVEFTTLPESRGLSCLQVACMYPHVVMTPVQTGLALQTHLKRSHYPPITEIHTPLPEFQNMLNMCSTVTHSLQDTLTDMQKSFSITCLGLRVYDNSHAYKLHYPHVALLCYIVSIFTSNTTFYNFMLSDELVSADKIPF
jgi:hypothetical protein